MGLEKLYQIARAETYDDRERLFCSGYRPLPTYFFLHDRLWYANEQQHDIFLNELTPEDELLYIRQPFFADVDSGPADAWRWAHYGENRQTWVYQENRRDLREWGYVMWDRSRLDAIGIFQEPWEDADDTGESFLEKQEAQRQRAYLQKSQEQRELVLSRGGTGWWSWGDESKVIWWDGKAPNTSAQRLGTGRRMEPHSLQEAREMLSMMKIPL